MEEKRKGQTERLLCSKDRNSGRMLGEITGEI